MELDKLERKAVFECAMQALVMRLPMLASRSQQVVPHALGPDGGGPALMMAGGLGLHSQTVSPG
jgi:hypothetical protein